VHPCVGGWRDVEIGLERIERDAREGREALRDFLGLQEELGGREHRPLDVVAPILVSRLDVVPRLPDRIAERRLVHQHRIAGQVVEERSGLVEEERQIELDARRSEALAHRAIHARAGRIAFEARPEAAPERTHRFGVERELARGQETYLLQGVERTLRVGIEAPDRLDLLAEEIDAQRRLDAHREHVEQRAAHRELAGGRHLTDRRVAGLDQSLAKAFERQRLADRELERTALHIRARRETLQEGVRRDDETPAASARQLVERAQTLGDDVGMRREDVVRQHLPVRKGQEGEGIAAEEAQLRRQPLELARAGYDHHVEPRVARCRLGERERGGAAVKLMPAQAGSGSGGYRGLEKLRHRVRADPGP